MFFFLFTPSLLLLSLSTYISICFFTLLSLGFIFSLYLNDLIFASLSLLSRSPSFGVWSCKSTAFFFTDQIFLPFFYNFFYLLYLINCFQAGYFYDFFIIYSVHKHHHSCFLGYSSVKLGTFWGDKGINDSMIH